MHGRSNVVYNRMEKWRSRCGSRGLKQLFRLCYGMQFILHFYWGKHNKGSQLICLWLHYNESSLPSPVWVTCFALVACLQISSYGTFVFFQAYGKYKLWQLGDVNVHLQYHSTVTAITNIHMRTPLLDRTHLICCVRWHMLWIENMTEILNSVRTLRTENVHLKG